jgi:hypothetical protein
MKNTKIMYLWENFINNSNYSKHFVDNITKWNDILGKLLKFFDTNNKKPSIKHNKYLYGWLHNQRRHYKHKKEIMKLEEIYKIWTEILNNPNYTKYILSTIDLWKYNFANLVEFINHNKSRPSISTNEILCNWLNGQIQNYKNRKNIMKNEEIYIIWHNFINDMKYVKYFTDNTIDEWKNNLDLLKKYIDENNSKPSQKTNKKLHSWMQHQVHNFTVKKQIMNNDEIYNLWNNFITSNEHAKYFNIDNIEIWKNNLENLKNYLQIHNKRPSSKDYLGVWLSIQIQNYKHKKQIMKNIEIYNLWDTFIKEPKIVKYFDLDNVRDWKINFEKTKIFIDTNNLRPTDKNDKKLSKWISGQIQNYRKMKGIMKNKDINEIWKNFINSTEYSKYFH